MNSDVSTLADWIATSPSTVFFGGAGVSTESGIPDFRGANGFYFQEREIPLETVLSIDFFAKHPEAYWEWFHEIYRPVDPNGAHRALAALEAAGRLDAVITQNIDGLHQLAGSKNVLELHGSIHRNYCMKCGKFYDAKYVKYADGVPRCECGGMIKPDVVLYEEGLDSNVIDRSIRAISEADTLIIGGTSLVVYPAAGLINYFRGDDIILINKSQTSYDDRATLVINDSIGKVLGD